MKAEPIYLDYAASTPPDPAVIAAMHAVTMSALRIS